MAGRHLTEDEGRAVVAWAAAPGAGGCPLVDVPPGPVRVRAPTGQGLLSEVTLLDTPAGPLAVKAPTARPSGLAWLDSRAAMRHEAAFYLAADSIEAPAALPRVVAVAPEGGVVVMEGIVPIRVLDQAAGLPGGETGWVVDRLGALHRSLRPLADGSGPPSVAEARLWPAVFADVGVTLPPFFDEFGAQLGPEGRALGRRLPEAWPAVAAAARSGRGGPATVCSMDMRADNLLVAGDRLVFIDWQLAATAPGGIDLAGFVSTSAADPVADAPRLVERYAAAAGIATDQARAGFLLGLVVRAAFAVPVVTRLPHPTARSRRLRRRAVERLAALLRAHADEIADRGLLG